MESAWNAKEFRVFSSSKKFGLFPKSNKHWDGYFCGEDLVLSFGKQHYSNLRIFMILSKNERAFILNWVPAQKKYRSPILPEKS